MKKIIKHAILHLLSVLIVLAVTGIGLTAIGAVKPLEANADTVAKNDEVLFAGNTWIVINATVQGTGDNSAYLVLSKEIVGEDYLYKENITDETAINNDWEGSNARAWCNSTYYNSLVAEDPIASEAIVPALIEENRSETQSTGSMWSFWKSTAEPASSGDKIFFLSIEEYWGYGNSDDYVWWWWLRNPNSEDNNNVAFVFDNGYVHGSDVNIGGIGVRPAMFLRSSLFTTKNSDGQWVIGGSEPVVQTGWQKIDGEWYYFKPNGQKAVSEWAKDSKGWCWMDSNGRITKNKWIKSGGEWYFLKSNGYMAAKEWTKDSGGWYWMNGSGRIAKNVWAKDSGGWYWMNGSGRIAKNAWAKDSGGWYWMNGSGRIAKNAWAKDSKGWCWMGSNGRITKSKWIKSGGHWYYLNSSGYMVTGTQKISGKTYKFDKSGKLIS